MPRPRQTVRPEPPSFAGRRQAEPRDLGRRNAAVQAVLLDLHRQLGAAETQADLARTLGLVLTGSFACERLAVLRRARGGGHFESVAEIGDVPAALHEEAPALAARLAPFLPHLQPLVPLLPAFAAAVAEPAERLSALGFARAAWLNVEKQVEFLVLAGPKLSGADYDELDTSLLRATLDAMRLACARLLLVDALEERNHELTLANRRLQRIDDLKTAILSGVSHELRTPLTRIVSYTEALRAGEASDEDTPDFLDIILDSAHRLTERIDNALHFAAVVGGRTAPQLQPVPLHDVVRAAAAAEAGNATSRSLRLVTRLEPLAAHTDPEYVRMILKCLLDNALRFTPEGGEVCVEATRAAAGIVLRVSDTGPGIPPEARDRIFSLFEPGDASLQREGEGLGLGLALARRLADQIGARLELERTGEAGSTFSLVLDAASAAADAAIPPDRATVASLRR